MWNVFISQAINDDRTENKCIEIWIERGKKEKKTSQRLQSDLH